MFIELANEIARYETLHRQLMRMITDRLVRMGLSSKSQRSTSGGRWYCPGIDMMLANLYLQNQDLGRLGYPNVVIEGGISQDRGLLRAKMA